MRKFIIILIAACLFSCEDRFEKRRFTVTSYNGSGWTWSESKIYCDSATMIDNQHATVYVDGVKINVIASDYLIIHSR